MKKRAVLYARVSSADREKHSLDAQLQMCRDYAHDKSYIVAAELQEDERGVSGADLAAPELGRALEMAEQDEYDVLVCREMDRLARSLAKQMIVEERLGTAGVRIEYVLAAYDDTPEGRLQKLVRASVAEYDRLKTVERLERGRRAAVRRGNVMTSGHPPFGYCEVELEDGRRSLGFDPETAEHAKLIFEWYVYGDGKRARLSLRAVALKLEALGVLSPADRNRTPYGHKKRPPGTWHYNSVRAILANPVYCGDWTYKATDGTRIVVPVPALVERKVWDKAQRRLKKNSWLASRNTRYQYLLRGRLRCEKCGYMMSGRRQGRYFYYRCNAAGRRDMAKTCDARYVRRDKLDERVWDCVVTLFSTPGAARKAYEELNEVPEATDAELAQLTEQSNRLQGRLLRLRYLYLDGDIDRAEYQKARDVLKAELEKLELRQRALFEHSSEADNDILDTLEGFTEAMHSRIANITDFEERLWYIDTLDIQIWVSPERVASIKARNIKIGAVECD